MLCVTMKSILEQVLEAGLVDTHIHTSTSDHIG